MYINSKIFFSCFCVCIFIPKYFEIPLFKLRFFSSCALTMQFLQDQIRQNDSKHLFQPYTTEKMKN